MSNLMDYLNILSSRVWDNLYIKDVIVWFITSEIIFCFNAATKAADEQCV